MGELAEVIGVLLAPLFFLFYDWGSMGSGSGDGDANEGQHLDLTSQNVDPIREPGKIYAND